MNTDKHRFLEGFGVFPLFPPPISFRLSFRQSNAAKKFFPICVYPCLSVAFPFSSFSVVNGYEKITTEHTETTEKPKKQTFSLGSLRFNKIAVVFYWRTWQFACGETAKAELLSLAQLFILSPFLQRLVEHLLASSTHPPEDKHSDHHERNERELHFRIAEEIGNLLSVGVREAEKSADDCRRTHQIPEKKTPERDSHHPRRQIDRPTDAHHKSSQQHDLEAVPLDRLFEIRFALRADEFAKFGMRRHQPMAKMIADGVHQAIAEQRAEETGREGPSRLQASLRAENASQNDRNLFRNRKPATGQHQEEDDAKIAPVVKYKIHRYPPLAFSVSSWGHFTLVLYYRSLAAAPPFSRTTSRKERGTRNKKHSGKPNFNG